MSQNAQDAGTALADVLFGDYNPGGRLVVTWPRSLEQLPPMMDYDLRNGRTYMYFKGEPLFPFGYGLSYTTFDYSGLRASASRLRPEDEITVSLDVKNTGARAGDEVVQLYVRHEKSKVERPKKELRGFERVALQPGETKTVPDEAEGRVARVLGREGRPLRRGGEPVRLMVGGSSSDITARDDPHGRALAGGTSHAGNPRGRRAVGGTRVQPCTAILCLGSSVSVRGAEPPPAASQPDPYVARPRVVVMTDIANEPDDQMSLVRFLVYSNEFDVEGLVATTSTWMKNKVRPDVIHSVLDAYEKVQPNLLKHAPGFPDRGGPARPSWRRASRPTAWRRSAADKMSPGAELILRAAEKADPRPLWVLAWGGDQHARPGAAVTCAPRGRPRRSDAFVGEAARLHDLRPGRRRALDPPRVSGAALHRDAVDARTARSTTSRPGPASAATASTATRPARTSRRSPTSG